MAVPPGKLYLAAMAAGLVGLCLFDSCETEKADKTPRPRVDTLDRIHFFLETSGSMGGYLQGKTEFREIVTEFANKASQLTPVKAPMAFYTVSSEVKALPANVDSFMTRLNTVPMATGHSSLLDVIFGQVREKARGHDLAVFVSDCILSLPREESSKNREANLEQAGSLLKNRINRQFAFLRRDSIGVNVYTYKSAFNGTYFDYQDKMTVLRQEQRPFYIWVMGRQSLLTWFDRQMQQMDIQKPEYFFEFNGGPPLTEFGVLYSYGNRGEWSWDEGLELKEITAANPTEFAVSLDLSSLPRPAQHPDYLMKNLEITPKKGGQLIRAEIKDQLTVTGVSDRKSLEKATHVLTFRLTQRPASDLLVALPARVDTGYKALSTLDDRQPGGRFGKTFALQYLMDGVREAFENGSGGKPYLLRITIPVKP